MRAPRLNIKSHVKELTFKNRQRLEALKEKSAKLRANRLDTFKDKAAALKKVTYDATVKVGSAAVDAGKRMSVSAREAARVSVRASRRFSMSQGRRSIALENGKTDPFDNSSSTHERSSIPEAKLDGEADHFAGDHVRNPSDAEEKDQDPSDKKSNSKEKETREKRLSTVPENTKLPRLRPGTNNKGWDPKTATSSRLHQAILNGKWDEAIWCIHKGADVKKWKGFLGETTLHEACMHRAPSP